jgi:APA family basic amino acid/polyamine antiporter
LPLPAVFGAAFSISVWVSVVIYHEGARAIGAGWMAVGLTLYVAYRRSQGKSLTQRFTIPPPSTRCASSSTPAPIPGRRRPSSPP